MDRVRISTTVDGTLLAHCQRLRAGPTSALIDDALEALADRLDAERETEILTALPYEDDEALAWSVPFGPDLPYTGTIPQEVLDLAAARRKQGH
ncbi:MAG: hypothetical protein ACT4OS_02690 [Acidimicrobiales bacterium]